ncbi:hypothetical protein OG819_22325 [Streptomyces sp. NBC_01549]|uniref:hypothetical protein n=1 Tax=unclassified Streptomyces TaxID=2593676 RepID=UPI00224D74F5|nr:MULTISPECIES: hypothetical protein [unclassified Streptomyces]MCX4592368.1 hypothetical protein [Streptomyces sp. NBC_01549]MDX3754004.1 hypothetical protein [Streptomyces sp. AK02-04a]
MSRVEYAAGDDPLYGPNPLTVRGVFPPHWGEMPDSPPALPGWIEANALRDGASKGCLSSIRIVLEQRREDPSAARERAAVETQIRLRREQLAAMLLPAPDGRR